MIRRSFFNSDAKRTALLPVSWFRFSAGFLLLIGGGCGSRDGIERVYLSGQITYDSQPVEVGQIRFQPTAGTNAPITIERFFDGSYETETSGGVPVGTYQVSIFAYTAKNFETWPAGPGSPPLPQLLPEKYNRQTELEIELEPGTGEKVVDFNLRR